MCFTVNRVLYAACPSQPNGARGVEAISQDAARAFWKAASIAKKKGNTFASIELDVDGGRIFTPDGNWPIAGARASVGTPEASSVFHKACLTISGQGWAVTAEAGFGSERKARDFAAKVNIAAGTSNTTPPPARVDQPTQPSSPSGRPKHSKPTLRLPHDHRMVEVRGESHYVATLERVVSAQGINLKRVDDFDVDDVWLRLIPEPTNPHDPRALMVASPEGHCLGYIGRQNAAKYAEIIAELAEGHDLWCRAQIGGGHYDDGWRIGVWVYMVSPGDLAKQAGQVAAQSVAALEGKWREATIIHTGAVDTFTATLAQMRAADQDPDGEHMQFARAGLEKAIRSYARAVKALQQAVTDFHGIPKC